MDLTDLLHMIARLQGTRKTSLAKTDGFPMIWSAHGHCHLLHPVTGSYISSLTYAGGMFRVLITRLLCHKHSQECPKFHTLDYNRHWCIIPCTWGMGGLPIFLGHLRNRQSIMSPSSLDSHWDWPSKLPEVLLMTVSVIINFTPGGCI